MLSLVFLLSLASSLLTLPQVVGPRTPGTMVDLFNAASAADEIRAQHLIDYSAEGRLALYRLPGNVCFLRLGGTAGQTEWVRRDDKNRVEILVSAPGLVQAGRRFAPDGTAQLRLGSRAVAVPVVSPGLPTWRFTLDETPALQKALDADEATLRFTAVRGGKAVPDETLSITAGNLWQAIQGLDSCAIGAEMPGVVGP